MRPRIAVIGYASLDHAMATGEFRGASGTTLVRSRLSRPWPAPGGVAHLGRALAGSQVDAEVVTWVGPDADGRAYVDLLRADGVGVSGVVTAGSRSPATFLIYPPDGSTVCVYDPGDCHDGGLAAAQTELLSGVDWLIVAVGPRAATEAALAAISPTTRVAWVVKTDHEAFPPELVRRLLASAAVVTCSAGERDFLNPGAAELRPDTLLVETRGAAGVRYTIGGQEHDVPAATSVSGVDTTGAGDTFAATLVATLAAERSRPPDAAARPAVTAALGAAATFLHTRAVGAGKES